MEDTIFNFFEQPIIVDASFRFRFTHVAVHPSVSSVSGHKYDVIFLGTGSVSKRSCSCGEA